MRAGDDVALPLEGRHWTFAVKLYSRPGVADCCLALQERLGVDVPLLLFAVFALHDRGISIDRNGVAALDARVTEWRAEMVVPLRGLRRRLKTGPKPAANAETAALREDIKRAELKAERIELAMLAQEWGQLEPRRLSSDIDPRPVVMGVIGYFADQNGFGQHLAEVPEIAECVDLICTVARTPA